MAPDFAVLAAANDDGGDYFHGARSAGKVIGLGLHRGIAPLTLEVALLTVTLHNVEDRRGEEAARRATDPGGALAVYRVLKDADALDRAVELLQSVA